MIFFLFHNKIIFKLELKNGLKIALKINYKFD